MTKVNREITAIAVGIARTEIIQVAQDHGAMRRIVHPPCHGRLGRSVPGAAVDDLPTPAPGIPGQDRPLPKRRSVRTGVGHEIINRHVFAVQSCRIFQGSIGGQRRQACNGTFVVNEDI